MNVGILLFHHVSELDAVGPAAVLAAAGRLLDDPELLQVSTVARSRFSVQTVAELTLTPGWAFASAPAYDTLIVPGGPGVEAAARDAAVRRYLEGVAPNLRRLCSVSSGALLLGELGFLRDQRATSHPQVLERLEDFEVLEAVAAPLVRNERVWCAGGMAAGLDLALALLAERFGDDFAERVRTFVGVAATGASG